MKDDTLYAITGMVRNITALIKAPYKDEGAIANLKSAISNLKASDTKFEDQDFVDACNELATGAALEDPKVVVASTESADKPEEKKTWMGGHKDKPGHHDTSAKGSGLV